MADKSPIEWTDATWNPVRGCSRVSAGCQHCYAEGIAARFSKPGMAYAGLATRVTRPDGSSEARWSNDIAYAGDKVLCQPLHWFEPRKIFVNSMSDLFHDGVPDAVIDRVFAVMAFCPQHTFQILTKRPARMRTYFDPVNGAFERMYEAMMAPEFERYPTVKETCAIHGIPWEMPDSRDDWWPLRNVWLGVSVEDQATADERIPALLGTPAVIRFISAEPLLGPIDLTLSYGGWPLDALNGWTQNTVSDQYPIPKLDWVIVGGESGNGARPMHPDWARSLRDQCADAGVAFMFKQWGAWAPLAKALPVTPGAPNMAAWPDGTVGYGKGRQVDGDGAALFRGTKGVTGRVLDGCTHDEFPSVRL